MIVLSIKMKVIDENIMMNYSIYIKNDKNKSFKNPAKSIKK